ncbi:MAG: hypothetical protein J5684_06405 [Eubacterium sp.]|nr:hypothetical protein [Eubacterium sp.]
MDFDKFKKGEENRASNTFDGDENLNPYAGSLDNYFEDNPASTDETDNNVQNNTGAYGTGSYNVSNYGKQYGSSSYDVPGTEYGRRAPTASAGKTKAIIGITFGLLFAYMGFAAYSNIVGKYKQNTEDVNIVEGYEPGEYENSPEYKKYELVRTKEEFKTKLVQMIQDGEEELYMNVTKDVSEDDVEEICQSLDYDPFLYKYSGFYYTTSTQRDGDGPEYDTGEVGVNVLLNPTTEGLVYLNLTEGKEIPADDIKASKLKVSCETFLKENITDGMPDYEKELAVHDYLINTCDYASSISDEKDEFTAYGVMLNKKAVCEGYARATTLLLKLCNIETELISGKITDYKTGEVTDEKHVWNLVKIDGKWYHLDTTWDDPTNDEEGHMYMNLDDSIISQNHEWDKSEYESCTSMDANYYTMQGTYFKDDESFQTYVRQQLEDGNRTTIECVVGDVDLSEETLGFIFEYEGVETYYLSWGHIEGYKHLVIHINGN